MRKIAAILLGAVLAAPAALQAQSANGTVTASATIEAILQVSNVGNLAFGNITPGSGATVTPGSGSGSLGVLEVLHNAELSVTASVPAALDHATEAGATLPVTFSCGWSDSANGALTGGEQACASLGNRTGPADGTPVTSYVQVGGSIAAGDTSNRVPGTYRGTLTFTFQAVY